MTTYRCVHCGSVTGHDISEAQQEAATSHGPGKCVSDCQYCEEGVPHAPHVCSNLQPDKPYPTWVRQFMRENSNG